MANEDETVSMEPLYHGDDDDDGDVVNDTAHEKLLNSLFAMDGKKRNKNDVRGIASQSGNLDLVVHAKKDEGKIKPQDLKLKARSVAGNLKKPMSSAETEMAKREIARETMQAEMKTWEPVVQEIRAAPQMVLSNRPHGIELRNAMKPKGFTPRTALEKELFAALGRSEDVLHPNKELTKAEEKALKAMSVKEAMMRRAELMKHHELLSRAQVRAKRVKKIKSKRYRKVLRKEKEGAERKELERLQQTDPEALVERLEQLEKDRMEERLTLKHRGGGKFARLHKVYSKFDDKTRDAMQDMLQKSRELTKKTANISSSDDDDDGDDVEEVKTQQSKNAKTASDNDDDGGDGNDGESKMNKAPLRTTQLDMLKAINKKAGGWLDGPSSTFVYVGGQNGQPTVDTSLDTPEGKAAKSSTSVKDSEAVSPLREAEALAPGDDGDVSEKNSSATETCVSVRKGGKRNRESMEDEDEKEEEEEPAAREPKKKKRKRNRKKGRENESQDGEGAGEGGVVKPKDKPAVEVTLQTPPEAAGEGDREEEEEDGDSVGEDGALKVTMEELFQDEDVVEEFAREKAAAEERARPKIEDTRLPGWGSWAGPDFKAEKPLTKKQKRAEAQARLLEKQQQKVKQPHVWLNPSRDDAIRKLQPKGVPFPFTSVQQYEASLRQPVSRGFVRETAFKLLNKPEVVTKLGHIIRPLDKEDVFKKKEEVAAASQEIETKGGQFGGKQVAGGQRGSGGRLTAKGNQRSLAEDVKKVGQKKDKQKRRGIS